MEEEEAGEVEVADRRQLALELHLGLAAELTVRWVSVFLTQPRPADLGELVVGARVLRAGIAVAELLGQVEAQPLGEAQGLGDRLGVLGEARRHPPGRAEHRARVAAASRLRGLQGRPQPDRDEGVLEGGAARVVGVDVAGRDAGHAEPGGELGEPAVAGAVVAPVGALQLDPEVVGAEGLQQPPAQPRRARRLAALPGARQQAVAGAAREADEPLGVGLDPLQRHPGLPGAALRALAGVGVRRGQQPAEVAVAGLALDQQGQVGAALEGQLGAGDRPHAALPAGDRELHRPPDPVVVGEGEGGVAVGRGGDGQLGRGRGAVQEGEGGVGVQLYVWGAGHGLLCTRPAQARCRYQRPPPPSRKTTASRPSASTSSK